MAEPKPDRRDVDEAQEAFGRLVVTGGDPAGILELVEAAFDQIAQPVEGAIHADAPLARLPHWDHWQGIALLYGSANAVSVVSPVGEQDARGGQVVGHHQIEPEIVRRLARRDLRSHGQAVRVDEKVDLGRETTTRTSETRSRSPLFEPAA